MNKKFKILICGAFGYGNLGDDILRDTLVELLYNRYDNIEIYVDRPYPSKELIEYCDLRIIGPGGLLYDGDETHESYFRQYMKSPYILFGVGIQFPENLLNDGFVNDCIKNAEMIFSREVYYTEDFKQLNPYIFYIPDVAFYNSSFKKTHIPFIKKNPHITICPNYRSVDLELIEIFRKKEFQDIIGSLISFHKEDDVVIDELRQLMERERTTLDYYYSTPQQAYNVIANSDLLITSRYHAAVMGIHAGIKVVNLCTDENFSYKLYDLISEQINFEKLISDPINYTNNISKKNVINGYQIDEQEPDFLKFLDVYLFDSFNVKRKKF